MPGEHSVDGILDELTHAAENGELSVGSLIEAFGQRGYGPFLVIPALIELTPIGGIPGVPTLLALVLLLFAGQMLMGRQHLWLPGPIERQNLSADRLAAGIRRLRPVARRLDRWFYGRLERFTTGRYTKLAASLCILLAFSVPPLEIVPFASSVPMLAIVLIGLALLVHDGVLMLLALGLALLAISFGISALSGLV